MSNMNNFKIILEGVDGSGKTTLANKIKDAFPDKNFKIVHLTRVTPNNKDYLNLFFSVKKISFLIDFTQVSLSIKLKIREEIMAGWMNMI